MIERPTLFVLGAGASEPYGYPTGAELRRYICDIFPGLFSDFIDTTVGKPVPAARSQNTDFSEAFRKSSTASIRSLPCKERRIFRLRERKRSLLVYWRQKKEQTSENVCIIFRMIGTSICMDP